MDEITNFIFWDSLAVGQDELDIEQDRLRDGQKPQRIERDILAANQDRYHVNDV